MSLSTVQFLFYSLLRTAKTTPNRNTKRHDCSVTFAQYCESRDGAAVRALASHQCGLGSIPGPSVIWGLTLLLVLYSVLRGFSPGTPLLPSPQKPNSILECTGISKEFLWTPGAPLVNKLHLHFLYIFLFNYCLKKTEDTTHGSRQIKHLFLISRRIILEDHSSRLLMKSRFTRKKQATGISYFARNQITIHESRSNHKNILYHPQISVTLIIECVHCHAIKNKIKSHAVDKVKKLRYYIWQIKKGAPLV